MILTLKRHSVQARLHQSIQILAGARGIVHMSIYQRRTLMVYCLGIGSDNLAAYLAKQVHRHLILPKGLLGISRCLGVATCLCKFMFTHLYHLFHVGVMQVKG